MMSIALLRIAGLVLKYARLPALLLVVVVVGNGLLTPLSVWLSRNVIDSATAAVRAGDGMRAARPWVLAFVVVLVLSNLRELLEQILKVRIAHKLRDNLAPLVADKVASPSS